VLVDRDAKRSCNLIDLRCALSSRHGMARSTRHATALESAECDAEHFRYLAFLGLALVGDTATVLAALGLLAIGLAVHAVLRRQR
jgi:hypothetical protein